MTKSSGHKDLLGSAISIVLSLLLAACSAAEQNQVIAPTLTEAPIISATSTSVPTAVPASLLPPSSTIPEGSQLLYAEDFEDESFDEWQTYSGNWKIVADDSNHVLRASGLDNYPQAWSLVGADWTDYAFETRIRIQTGTLFICVRSDHGRSFYNTHISTNYTQIQFSDRHDNGYLNFGSGQFRVLESEWYLMRFEVQGTQLRFFINDRLILSSERDSLPSGQIGYYMEGGSIVLFDDIQVWSLTD
jgi:hypothetical protein